MSEQSVKSMTSSALDIVLKNRKLIQESAKILQKLGKTTDPKKRTDDDESNAKDSENVSSLTKLTSMEVTRNLPAYMIEEIKEKRERTTLSVADDRSRFFEAWTKVIHEFVNNANEETFECPTDLSGFDRKELHRLAQKYNLGHHSVGFHPDRRLILTKDKLFYANMPSKNGPIDVKDLVSKLEPSLHRSRRPVSEYEAFDPEAAKKLLAERDRRTESAANRDVLSRLAQFQKSSDSHAEAEQCSRIASSTMIGASEALHEDDMSLWQQENTAVTTATAESLGTKWSNVLDPHIERMEKPQNPDEGQQMYPYRFGPEDTPAQDDQASAAEVLEESKTGIAKGCGRKRNRPAAK